MNRKLNVFLIFIVLLVGISCVSAENIDDTSDLSTNDADDMISVDASLEDIGDSSTNDADNSLDDDFNADENDDVPTNLRGSTTVNTWSDLGGAVYNNNNYDTVYIGANLTPGDQIVINHDVTIIGSADTYIGGSSSSSPVSYSNIPIYSSASGLSITLKNIRFQNCGGNILMKFSGNGNYILDNCTFENVTATGDHQSVVHLNLGNCEIINCTFEKCTTSYGTVSNYNENSVTNVHMTVRDSTFKDNHATVEPGCINNCGQLEVYDSIFEGNSATWWAGAIHTHNNANTTIARSIFTNNIAGWNGGALYTYSHLTVIDSIFTGNEAHSTSGGAIAGSGYLSRPYLTVLNCEFNDNIASGSGGAISFGSSELIVDGSTFNNNRAASGTGGAISTSSATSTITYSNFTNNSATGRGGAIYATGNGQLNVYHCNFLNNTGSEGQDIAYHYTTKKTNKAFLTYDYNEFWGANNASGSIYAYNTQYLVLNNGTHNIFHDISEYVVPSGDENITNDTNTTGEIITIPPGTTGGNVTWSISLGNALTGTPVISGNYILIPAGPTLYCYYLNGTYCWNVTSFSEYNAFCEVTVDNGIVYAPCSLDKLYILNLGTGDSLTDANIYQASSIYAPLVVGDTIYVCSEYGYGQYNNTWIAVVKLINGNYTYVGSILEINNVTYGDQALLSKPILDANGNLWVNTVNGTVCIDLSTGNKIVDFVSGTVGNIVIDFDDYIYVMANISGQTQILYFDSADYSMFSEDMNIGSYLAVDNNKEYAYTVSDEGNIYCIDFNDVSYSFIYRVNAVSSAISAKNNSIYVGDNAGILWVFDNTYHAISWAFNATSPIVGGIAVNNNIAYIGTEDGTFYAVKSS